MKMNYDNAQLAKNKTIKQNKAYQKNTIFNFLPTSNKFVLNAKNK